MIDLEKTVGPLRLRTWGLVLNMIANGIALYGLSRVLAGEGGWPILIVGAALTVICIAVCAKPAK
jgi:hypothetical protein